MKRDVTKICSWPNKGVKSCSASLGFREIQIKITMRCFYISSRKVEVKITEDIKFN